MAAGGSIDERQPTQPSRRKTGTLALAIRRGRWSDAPPDGTLSSAGRPAAPPSSIARRVGLYHASPTHRRYPLAYRSFDVLQYELAPGPGCRARSVLRRSSAWCESDDARNPDLVRQPREAVMDAAASRLSDRLAHSLSSHGRRCVAALEGRAVTDQDGRIDRLRSSALPQHDLVARVLRSARHHRRAGHHFALGGHVDVHRLHGVRGRLASGRAVGTLSAMDLVRGRVELQDLDPELTPRWSAPWTR